MTLVLTAWLKLIKDESFAQMKFQTPTVQKT